MNKEALGTYLTDHLAGAAAGLDLAEQICSTSEGTTVGTEMIGLVQEIAEDRETLKRYADEVGVGQHPIKEAGGAVAEKVARLKLDPRLGGHAALKRMLALESLEVGIAGKVGLWRALQAAMDQGVDVPPLDTARLIERGNDQIERVERLRCDAVIEALA
jgi:hypothetical protein